MRAALALLTMLLATPTWAHPTSCFPLAQLVELTAQYGEKPIARGPAGNDGSLLVVLYLDRNDASWSVVMIIPPDTACLLASGTDWERIDTADGDPS